MKMMTWLVLLYMHNFLYLYLFNMIVFLINYIKYVNQIYEIIFFASGALECKLQCPIKIILILM